MVHPSGFRGDAAIILAILVVGSVLALFGVSRAIDAPFATQMWTMLAAFVLGGAGLIGVSAERPHNETTSRYQDNVIKAGVIAAMFWGVAGLLVGVIIALQLSFPDLFYFPEMGWTNFGRLRPLHTSAVIFAFGGNVLISTSFYVVQRTCRALGRGALAVVRVLGLSAFHSASGHGLSDGRHRRPRIR